MSVMGWDGDGDGDGMGLGTGTGTTRRNNKQRIAKQVHTLPCYLAHADLICPAKESIIIYRHLTSVLRAGPLAGGFERSRNQTS